MIIPPYKKVFYNRSDIITALEEAGFPDYSLDTMAAIAVAESSWSNAIQIGQPYDTTGWGTWQITPGNSVPSVGINEQLLDLVTNARAAHVKWSERGYYPWTTWVNGAYKHWLGHTNNLPSQLIRPAESQSMAAPITTQAHPIGFVKGSDDDCTG